MCVKVEEDDACRVDGKDRGGIVDGRFTLCIAFKLNYLDSSIVGILWIAVQKSRDVFVTLYEYRKRQACIKACNRSLFFW